MSEPAATTIPPELISTICSNCGYSLEGLAANVPCPECGREQKPGEVVLYGWARGSHERESNAKPSRFLWVLLCGNLWLIFNVFLLGRLMAMVWIAVGVATIAFALVRRRESLHSGKIQVRLNASGCVQYDSTAGRSLLGELLIGYGWVMMLLAIVPLVVWRRAHQSIDDAIIFWMILVVLTLLTPILGVVSWKFRRATRAIPENAIIDSNAAYYKPTAWSRIGGFTLERLAPSRYRLQIRETDIDRLYKIRIAGVDAEIELTDEKAELLRELVHSWMDQLR